MTTESATGWRALCLSSLAGVLVFTGAPLDWGVGRSETALREALMAWGSPATIEVARWVSHGGTWRVLVPATLVVLALSRHARRRWWLWGAVLVAAPALSEAWQELVGRTRPNGLALGFPVGTLPRPPRSPSS